jgi:myo-inositol-1(or 4)-monophosphatase
MFPMFGVSIAFVRDSQVRAAGVRMPMLDATFLAQRGAGATRNGKSIRVGEATRLDHARVEVDLGNHPARDRAMAMFSDVMLRAGQVRCVCAAVVGLCSVACADADAYFCAGLSPWDYAAAMLIVEEAGGRVTRLDGVAVDLFDRRWGMLATNGALHDEGLRTIQPLPESHPIHE